MNGFFHKKVAAAATNSENPAPQKEGEGGGRAEGSPKEGEGNLTLVQLLLSIGIVLFHCYILGSSASAPVRWHRFFFGSRGESLGTICVNGFLVLSGYMLSHSTRFAGSGGFRDAGVFAAKRLIRIFPGIVFVSLIAVFAVGPAFTTQGIRDYFGSSATWDYLVKSLNLFGRPPLALPGVFDGNAFKQIVNGSLWMIPWLMWCYVLFAVALLFRFHKNRMFVALLWVMALYGCTIEHDINQAAMFCGLWAHDGLRLLGSFTTGWALYVFRDRILLDGRFALAMLALTPLWLDSDAHAPASCLLSGYVLCVFCFHAPSLPCTRRLPRIHWEIYLLAFMVQQCVTAVHGGEMSPIRNFLYSMALTIPLAMVLHLLVNWTSKSLRNHLLPVLERR